MRNRHDSSQYSLSAVLPASLMLLYHTLETELASRLRCSAGIPACRIAVLSSLRRAAIDTDGQAGACRQECRRHGRQECLRYAKDLRRSAPLSTQDNTYWTYCFGFSVAWLVCLATSSGLITSILAPFFSSSAEGTLMISLVNGVE